MGLLKSKFYFHLSFKRANQSWTKVVLEVTCNTKLTKQLKTRSSAPYFEHDCEVLSVIYQVNTAVRDASLNEENRWIKHLEKPVSWEPLHVSWQKINWTMKSAYIDEDSTQSWARLIMWCQHLCKALIKPEQDGLVLLRFLYHRETSF